MFMANIGTGAKSCNHFLAPAPIFMANDTTGGSPESPGARLRQWIDAKYGGWGGQKKCAAETGIDEGSLSKYVNDRRSPDWESVSRLADAGLNIDWWLKGRGPMNAPTKHPSEVGSAGRFVGTVTFRTVTIDGKTVTILEGLEPHDAPEYDGGNPDEE